MNLNLLIVEDDLIFGKLLKRSLKEVNLFNIHLEHNINDALNYIKSYKIHYAVLDLKLNNDSSLKLISEIKDKNIDAKILILTGYSSIATAVEAIKLGAIQYLPKPASIDDILKSFEITQHGQNQINFEISDQPLSVGRLEWEHIQRVLTENHGNISATARALNMHRRTLQRKLNEKNPPKI